MRLCEFYTLLCSPGMRHEYCMQEDQWHKAFSVFEYGPDMHRGKNPVEESYDKTGILRQDLHTTAVSVASYNKTSTQPL